MRPADLDREAHGTAARLPAERLHDLHTGGLRFQVSDRGPRGERPLVMIMGLGATHQLWDPLRQALGEPVRTLAFDNPGVGASSTPMLPLRLPGLARVVIELLRDLGLREFDLLGLSLGGMIAQEVARRDPRVRRLVLVATTPGLGGVPGQARAAAIMATPRRYYDEAYLRRIAPILYGGRLRDDPELLAQQVHARLSNPPSIRGYYQQLWAAYGWSSRLWLHQIRIPTLVIGGDDDPVTPLGNSRILARSIPGAQLEVIPGGGHLFPVVQADVVAPIMRRFLEGSATDAALGGTSRR
jgi:poly(3-hydroxyoctanoate) depolymerase